MEVGCYNHLTILVPCMNRFNLYIPLLLSLMIYVGLWWMLDPVLGYNLDSDCVAYLTIAERVAAGDYFKSINGLWSPLNSWFVAFFIKNGYDAWSSAKFLNFIFGGIIIMQSFLLFLKFKLQQHLIFYLQIALSIAMVYFVYFQMFGDVLQLIFVISYLFVLWYQTQKPITFLQAAVCGIIMGMAFYAKAYSFFFFGLHFLATLILYIYLHKVKVKRALMLYGTGIGFAIITMLPWTIALHEKYNEWSLNGQAGKLNMSWYINSGKSFRSDIQLLIPPVYDDSPSFWEDPYLTQENLSSPFSSATHFVKWIFRIVHTTVVCIFCFQEISFLSLAALLIAIFYFFFYKRKQQAMDDTIQEKLLIITICILPLGYLMMHIETRYIWLNVVLLMLLSALLFKRADHLFHNIFIRHVVAFIIAVSFMIYPLLQFENLKYKNKDLFMTANALSANNIRGTITSNGSDAGRMWVIAWLTKSQFYTIEKSDYKHAELLAEMKRYGVKYYFFESENNVAQCNIEGMRYLFTVDKLSIYERVN